MPRKLSLQIRDLTFHRDWQVILHAVNLELYAGNCLVLRGENGAGKSTLLKLCVGLLAPTSGIVELPGTHSYLGHLNGIKATQTLSRILRSLPRKYQLVAREISQVLGLEAYCDVPYHQLSAGFKRRVALVPFLTPKVNLYIVDEPLDNLDPAARRLVWQLMLEKVEKGVAVLMTHHGDLPSHSSIVREVRILPGGGLVNV